MPKTSRVLFAALWILSQTLLPYSVSAAQTSVSQPSSVVMPRAKVPGTPLAKGAVNADLRRARSPLDQKVTIRAKSLPLSAFLEVISSQTKVSFITGEGLEKLNVTAFLKDVTVREALQYLLQVLGLNYQRIGNTDTYVVMKRTSNIPRVITRIYPLSFISLQAPEGVSKEMGAITAQGTSTDLLSAGLLSGGYGGYGGNYGGGVTLSKDPAEAAGKPGMEGGIAIVNVLQSVLTTYGKLAVEPRTNSLVITDVPEIFPQIDDILAELDKKAAQVLIESQIAEVNVDRLDDLGVQWGDETGKFAQFTGPSRNTGYLLRDGFWNNGGWKKAFVSSDTFATEGTIDLTAFQVILKALVTNSEARFLGKPKVVTLNNRTAIITSSTEAAVSINTVSTTAGAGGTTSTQVERRRVGLSMRVTPQVNTEGFVTLLVQPSYSDVATSSLTSADVKILDPISRGVSTQVRVKNGQTVVLGGLISTRDENVERKVPLLGSIPVLGWLFTTKSKTKKNTELIIAITPTVLVD